MASESTESRKGTEEIPFTTTRKEGKVNPLEKNWRYMELDYRKKGEFDLAFFCQEMADIVVKTNQNKNTLEYGYTYNGIIWPGMSAGGPKV
jgi:hypothetical protein